MGYLSRAVCHSAWVQTIAQAEVDVGSCLTLHAALLTTPVAPPAGSVVTLYGLTG